jgi:CDP-glycerol glycerophosphotransferase
MCGLASGGHSTFRHSASLVGMKSPNLSAHALLTKCRGDGRIPLGSFAEFAQRKTTKKIMYRLQLPSRGLRRLVVQVLVHILPAGSHTVVAGWPDEEGNSVEVVRGLPSHIGGRVYWLADAQPNELLWLLDGVAGKDRIRLLRKRSVRGFLAYATARTVFFTHGLYSCPRPPKRKTFVNLWHGDGPKRTDTMHDSPRIPSSYVVAGTELWGQYKADFFGVPRSRLLITGNPRVDQFTRPLTDEQLEALGVPAAKPLVLWLPTYRGARGPSGKQWDDSSLLSTSPDLQEQSSTALATLHRLGATVVVKPHPLDRDTLSITGIRVITNDDLRRVQGSLYQLLARASGLITDYSSAWTDFLALDRPIGFYCPDLREYAATRGFNVPDLLPLLPGPLLEHPDELATLVRACVTGPQNSTQLRRDSVRRIGAETRLGATARLLELVLPASRNTASTMKRSADGDTPLIDYLSTSTTGGDR